MEEGRAGKWRNEGGEARRGEHDVREWGWRKGGQGSGEMKEGRQVGEIYGVKEGREGDAGRGRAWSE